MQECITETHSQTKAAKIIFLERDSYTLSCISFQRKQGYRDEITWCFRVPEVAENLEKRTLNTHRNVGPEKLGRCHNFRIRKRMFFRGGSSSKSENPRNILIWQKGLSGTSKRTTNHNPDFPRPHIFTIELFVLCTLVFITY